MVFDLVIEKNIVSRGKNAGKDCCVTGKGEGGGNYEEQESV